jgi:hypothetical protein
MYVEFPYLKNLQAFGKLNPQVVNWLRKRAIARISILLVFFAANVGTFARAQTQQGPPSGGTLSRPSTWDPRPFDPSVEAARQKALKLKQANALKRLNQMVDDADLIVDASARSRLLARIAAVLWTYDEPRARSLFKFAYDQAINVPKSEDEIYAKRPTCGTVRAEIAQLLSSIDHKFAAQLVIASALENCDSGPRNRASSEDIRSQMFTNIALAIVDDDPAGAYRLGLNSLDLGISFHIGDLLKKLFAKDESLGRKLLDACITRAASTDVNALEIVHLMQFLFADEVSIDPKQRAAAKTEENAELKKAFSKRLLEAALKATDRFVGKIEAQQQGKQKPDVYISDPDMQKVWTHAGDIKELSASYNAMMLNVIEGIRRYDPDELSAAQGLVERLTRWMDPLDRKHFLLFYDNGDTPQSLAAEAETTANPDYKRELYKYAFWLALNKADDQQALEYVAKLDDQDLRDELTDSIWSRKSAMTPAERFADAHALIEKIKRPEARLYTMLQLAERTSRSDDKQKQALILLLDEAEQLTLSAASSSQQASIMMWLARLYAQADPNRGFDETAKAIEMFNSVAEPPIADKSRWQFRPQFRQTDGLSLFTSDSRLFETLATSDYDRTIQLAGRFKDPSLVIAAQLIALRTALPPKAVSKN